MRSASIAGVTLRSYESGKVVLDRMQRHGMTVILDLFRKAICQERKAAHTQVESIPQQTRPRGWVVPVSVA